MQAEIEEGIVNDTRDRMHHNALDDDDDDNNYVADKSKPGKGNANTNRSPPKRKRSEIVQDDDDDLYTVPTKRARIADETWRRAYMAGKHGQKLENDLRVQLNALEHEELVDMLTRICKEDEQNERERNQKQ